MKVVVVKPFADIKDFSKQYNEGDVIDVGRERAENLIERGLVKEDKKTGKAGNE